MVPKKYEWNEKQGPVENGLTVLGRALFHHFFSSNAKSSSNQNKRGIQKRPENAPQKPTQEVNVDKRTINVINYNINVSGGNVQIGQNIDNVKVNRRRRKRDDYYGY